VWSEEGLGSTFTLRIPLGADADQPADDAGPERPPVPPLHGRPTTDEGPAGAPQQNHLERGRS
jgi:two-component system sensor histidine kinase SenX3